MSLPLPPPLLNWTGFRLELNKPVGCDQRAYHIFGIDRTGPGLSPQL